MAASQPKSCLLPFRRVGVEHDGDPFDAWRDLREQLQQLASNFPFCVDEAGDIPARERKARNETSANRVGDDHKYDRDHPRLLLERCGDWSRVCEDHVRLQVDLFFREHPHPIDVAIGPTIIDPNVATVHPTQLLKPLNKCCEIELRFRIVFVPPHQHADPPHPLGLLRMCSKRPSGCCTQEERYAFTTPHSRP